MKKYIITIGAVASAIIPMSAVVSCSEHKEGEHKVGGPQWKSPFALKHQQDVSTKNMLDFFKTPGLKSMKLPVEKGVPLPILEDMRKFDSFNQLLSKEQKLLTLNSHPSASFLLTLVGHSPFPHYTNDPLMKKRLIWRDFKVVYVDKRGTIYIKVTFSMDYPTIVKTASIIYRITGFKPEVPE